MNIIFPKVEERTIHYLNTSLHSLSQYQEISNYKTLINSESGDVFGILSKKYQLVKHEDAIEMVEEAIEKSPEYGKYDKQITFPSKGGKMHATYIFPEVEVPVTSGDSINPKIEIFNSYDGQWRFNIIFGAFRLVCSNGLVIGEKVFQYQAKHFSTFDEMIVKKTLKESMDAFSEQTQIWKTWVNKVLAPDQYEQIMEQLPLGKKQRKEIRTEVEVSSGISLEQQKHLTWWIFFNILCQYVSHRIKSNLRRIEIERVMRRVF